MADEKLPTDASAQRNRLLTELIQAAGAGVTSYRANTELGIYHPPARVKELRQLGHKIVTQWDTVETDLSKPRRVARYVLVAGGDLE